MKKSLLFFVGLLLLLGVALPVKSKAAVSGSISVQGMLTENGIVPNNPVDNTLEFIFRVFESDTGGVLLYKEAQKVVVINGIYNVQLGAGFVDPDDGTGESGEYGNLGSVPADYSELWLEVEVNDEILSPRQYLSSVPFSFHSDSSDVGGGPGSVTSDMIVDGTITSIDIATGAITAQKISSGAFMDSIAGLCSNGEVLVKSPSGWSCGLPPCPPNSLRSCYSGPEVTLDVGICAAGIQKCLADGTFGVSCEGELLPATEVCDNNVDDDCDTHIDLDDSDCDGIPVDMDKDGYLSDVDCNDNNPDVHPGVVDDPDVSFLDSNCDGIDGDLVRAVFVSSSLGADANTGFSSSVPMATIQAAADRAVSTGRDQVLLMAGTYNESLTFTAVHDRIGIYGGYGSSWVRNAWSMTGHTAIIKGGYMSSYGQYITIAVDGLQLTFANLQIEGPDALQAYSGYGRSSYAVYSKAGSNLIVDQVEFIQGDGYRGIDGVAGTSAISNPAASGGNGQNGDESSTTCSDSRRGGGAGATNASCSNTTAGGGGSGGSQDTDCSSFFNKYDARPGLPGSNASYSISPYGKGGRGGGVCGSFVGAGTNGKVGEQGIGGSGGGPGGFSMSSFWYANKGLSAQNGTDGTGGGGGGGAGGCDSGTDDAGAGGGGGGAGGCRGYSGSGGYGGGGSFGVFAVSSTVKVTNSVFNRGNGGAGGSGGSGGLGQPGGSGGSGGLATADTSPGGNGGNGGAGGNGGNGGGGAGGDSYGIMTIGSSLTQTGNNFFGGTGGLGGSGSLGANGTVGTVKQ